MTNGLNTYTECLGCDVFTLPQAPVCVPKPRFSQIVRLVILPYAAQLPLDWTDGAAWDEVVNNSNTTIRFGRILHGKGGIVDPTEVRVQLGKVDQIITRRRYLLEFETPVSDENRDLILRIQKGVKDFTFWYFTAGSMLFGGASGIVPLVITAVAPLGAGANDFELARIRFEFLGDVEPTSAYVPDFADVDLYSGQLIDDAGETLIDDNNDALEV